MENLYSENMPTAHSSPPGVPDIPPQRQDIIVASVYDHVLFYISLNIVLQ